METKDKIAEILDFTFQYYRKSLRVAGLAEKFHLFIL